MQVQELPDVVTTNRRIHGKVIEENVSYENFLSRFEGQHVEWVYGWVIEMSPVTAPHNQLTNFLLILLDYFLAKDDGGKVFSDPMVMKGHPDLPARQPDIQVILKTNLAIVKKTQVTGPADLVIEVVSPESQTRDRVEKYDEYERAGVKEYWIVDYEFQESMFLVLENGKFVRRAPDENGIYTSTVLPKLRFAVKLLWQDEFPRGDALVKFVNAMFEDKID